MLKIMEAEDFIQALREMLPNGEGQVFIREICETLHMRPRSAKRYLHRAELAGIIKRLPKHDIGKRRTANVIKFLR